MPTNVSEMNLEDTILAYLRDKQGYEEGTTNDYVKDYALDTERNQGDWSLSHTRYPSMWWVLQRANPYMRQLQTEMHDLLQQEEASNKELKALFEKLGYRL